MMEATWFHLSVKTIGRATGRSVVAAAAYRLGDRFHDQTYGLVHDYRARSGVGATFSLAPSDAPAWASDPAHLWNAAERAERRRNSTLAREVELALPAAVTPQARIRITQALSTELVDRYGVAVSAAIHEPPSSGDTHNHHAHILFTTRVMGAQGLGSKTRELDDRTTGPQEIVHLREFAADLINAELMGSGSDERVDHRSYLERGIEQEPTTHLGPGANHKERRGQSSDRGEINREALEINRQRQTLDKLVDELSALDAEIAAATAAAFEEGRLAQPRDAHPKTVGECDLPDTPDDRAAPSETYTFDELHRQTCAKAEREVRVMAAERSNGWNEAVQSRIERVGRWWSNLRESFVEWRQHLQQSAVSWWDSQQREGAARAAAEPIPTPDEGGRQPEQQSKLSEPEP